MRNVIFNGLVSVMVKLQKWGAPAILPDPKRSTGPHDKLMNFILHSRAESNRLAKEHISEKYRVESTPTLHLSRYAHDELDRERAATFSSEEMYYYKGCAWRRITGISK